MLTMYLFNNLSMFLYAALLIMRALLSGSKGGLQQCTQEVMYSSYNRNQEWNI